MSPPDMSSLLKAIVRATGTVTDTYLMNLEKGFAYAALACWFQKNPKRSTRVVETGVRC